MKRIILIALLAPLCVIGQTSTKSQIETLYQSWEKSIKDKQSEGHLDFYQSKNALIHIVKKDTSGPLLFGLFPAERFVQFWAEGDPYQLAISDTRVHADDVFAMSNARFDEYSNGTYSAYGRDMFQYVKVGDEWKLFSLHNTVELVGEAAADVRIPKSGLLQTLNQLELNYRTKSEAGNPVFLAEQSPVLRISANGSQQNQLFAGDFMKENDSEASSLDLANFTVHYIDDYLATVFCDYRIGSDKETAEKGRAMIGLMAHKAEWRVTSLVLHNQLIDVEAASYFKFGASETEIREMLADHTERIEEITQEEIQLPTAKKSQTQLNCYGVPFAGEKRDMEFVFGDHQLDLVWVLTDGNESESLLTSLKEQYGEPTHEIEGATFFLDNHVGLRSAPHELMYFSDRLEEPYQQWLESMTGS